MNFKAVMFDLDGTLADTLGDIAAAANHAFTVMGQPTQKLQRFRYLAGQGLERLFTDALPDLEHADVESYIAPFRAYYADHSMDSSVLFPGIEALLDHINQKGMKLAVLSNKPDGPTQLLCQKLMSPWDIDVVLGHREPYPLKPDPTSALAICKELDIAPKDWMYVGDTDVDMYTAKNAEMFAVGVLWGFRDEPELRKSGANVIVSDAQQIIDLL
ncbi:MAG: HAD family hydrolase [Phycisphaeraceae bacterium]|nr:HAD family hydrolase [Phycisphaeraceae bacterium]